MAKTQQQWYDVMLAERLSHVELTEANSASVTAVWMKFLWVVAFAAATIDALLDQFMLKVIALVATSRVGTAIWYKTHSLQFQYGDDLVWDEGSEKFVYAVIDESKQIVSSVAIVFSGGEVRIKAVKENNVPLTVSELAAFDYYWLTSKPPGTSLSTISLDADDLRIDARIIYDPLVMAANGSLISDSNVYPVEDAVDEYIANLDFNGRFWEDKLNDKIQAATGVVSSKVLEIQTKTSGGAYATIDQYYDSVAGHLIKDDANSTMTYENV
jgi:hypothetical protein